MYYARLKSMLLHQHVFKVGIGVAKPTFHLVTQAVRLQTCMAIK